MIELRLDDPEGGHHAHGREHDHVADGRGDGGDAVILGVTQRHADREDQGQVAEDDVARELHQVGKQGGHPVEFGGADSQEQAGHRQHGDRQHQGLADLLQESKGL